MRQDNLIHILTYDRPHRKTYDTLACLLANGYSNIQIFAKPFSYEKKFFPLIKHRPDMENNLIYEWNYFGLPCIRINSYDEINVVDGSVFLVCGAGILPQKFLQKFVAINAHPGYIPYYRGLDAYKWAVYENAMVGVTTHIIGEEIDAGIIIEQKEVPVYPYDTFHSVAYRQYDFEIAMLVKSISLLDNPHIYVSGGQYPVRKRMPKELEEELFDRFTYFKDKHNTHAGGGGDNSLRNHNTNQSKLFNHGIAA